MMKIIKELRKGYSRMKLYTWRFSDYFFVPRWYYRNRREEILHSLRDSEMKDLATRLNYYNKLTAKTAVATNATTVSNYRFPFRAKKRLTKYWFDLYETVRYFPGQLRFCFLFGDVIHVPNAPTFVKSRPVSGDNANSVVMKLEKWRHFRFVNDPVPFREKKDMLVGRTTWANANPLRSSLYDKFCNHPMCNVGKTRLEENDPYPETVKGFLSIREQLEYKFIACIEGNDVATNMKWVMSSNSVAVCPRPKYETWFMEGLLKSDYHYIEVKDDYSDLIEKLNYYITHPDEAEAIIRHAHEYIAQFRDERRELVLQLLVADKYFRMTNRPTKSQ